MIQMRDVQRIEGLKFYKNGEYLLLNFGPSLFKIYHPKLDRVVSEIDLSQPNKVYSFDISDHGSKWLPRHCDGAGTGH